MAEIQNKTRTDRIRNEVTRREITGRAHSGQDRRKAFKVVGTKERITKRILEM